MEDLKTKKYGDLYNHLCSAQFIADEIGDELADEILRIREKIGKKLLDKYGIKHDLEKEIHNYLDNHNLSIQDGGRIVFANGDTPNFMCDFRDIARHFFELGLKAKDVNEIIKTAEDHAYFAGSENTREKLIEKACKWLKENAYFYVNDYTGSLNDDMLVNEFHKAMKE